MFRGAVRVPKHSGEREVIRMTGKKCVKISSFLLAVCLIVGCFATNVFASVFSDVAADSPYREAIEVLSAFDIVQGNEDGSFLPEQAVTRAEFAALIIRAANMREALGSVSGARFSDVAGHWAENAVNLAAQLGYMNGHPDGTFAPDDIVTYEQALKVLVIITGYQVVAEDRGGYPSGYLAVASQNGITKHTAVRDRQALNRGEVAQLLYDAMQVVLLVPDYYSEDGMKYVKDPNESTLLSILSGYDAEVGIVNAVGRTSIEAVEGTADADEVIITIKGNPQKFSVGTTNVEEYLGQEVKFHAVQDDINSDEYILTYVEPTTRNKVLALKAEDISGAEIDSRYDYYRDGKREQRALLSANVVYIYNGEYEDALTSESMIPRDGSVTLIDNNGDNRFEVVMIEDYQHAMVSAAKTEDDIVTIYILPGSKTAFGQIEINPQEDSKFTTVYLDGKKLSHEELKDAEIKKWTAVSVARSKSENSAVVRLSTKTANGTLTEIKTVENGRLEYAVDGERYRTGADFSETLSLGKTYMLAVSFDDKLIGLNTEASSNDKNYGLILESTIESTVFDEGRALFKMLLQSGSVQVLGTSDKVRVDDLGAKRLTVADLEEIGVKTVVVYTTNKDGEITEIETADTGDVCTTESGYISYNKDKKFAKNVSTNLYYKNVSPPTLGGDMKMDENTIVYDVSAGDEKEWGVGDYTLLNNETVYQIDAYDLDEYKTAKVVVCFGPTVEARDLVPWDASPLLITENFTTLNEDGEAVSAIRGMQSGEETEYLIRDKEVCDEERQNYLVDMTPGSVIQIKKNMLGEIVKIRKLYKAPTDTQVFETMGSRDWNGSGYSVRLHTAYGMATDANGVVMTLATRSSNGQVRAYSIESANIYVYDTKNETAKAGTYHDMKLASAYGYDDCSRVFLRMEKDLVKDIVIYD